MTELIQWFKQTDFLTIMWLFPVVNTIHVVEEMTGLARWYQKNYAEVPETASIGVPAFLLNGVILGFVVTGIIDWVGDPVIAAWVTLTFAALLLWNGLQHIYHTLYFRQYVPAVITSIVLLVPSIVYLFIRALQDNLVPFWYVGLLIFAVLVGLVLVVTAGKKLTGEFILFNSMGLSLVRLVGNNER
jgi:Protein of unknown function with HXXEE motif